jgi:hypothetical protein
VNIILRASEGKWLTDGVTYAKTVDLAEGVGIERYTEITNAEYEEIQKGEESDE